jgi:NAD-dependent histone deacetylase SIR2
MKAPFFFPLGIPIADHCQPDITFFGEKLPDLFFSTLQKHDRDRVDLVIVMGTSMKVAPVSEIPNYLPATVPQIYISRDVRAMRISSYISANSFVACQSYQLRHKSPWRLRHDCRCSL